MGWNNAVGLKNGTSGWVLAGYELETGADRVELPQVSEEGLAAAEAYASRVGSEDGVRHLDLESLQAVLARRHQETVYLVDVRTQQEFDAGHIPGFRWFPGGQVVQRSDDVAAVKNATIVFTCDKLARGTMVASFYRQLGFKEVFAVNGGTEAWKSAGLELETGMAEIPASGMDRARAEAQLISPQDLQTASNTTNIFIDTSQAFSRAHVPGARWIPRGSLEFQIAGIAPSKDLPIAVSCIDGNLSFMASQTLKELGYQDVSVLDGGMAAWTKAGFTIEQGLSGVMGPPTDMVLSGPDRNYADMMTYLRWETALGEKYAAD